MLAMQDELLTTKEVAEILKCSEETAKRRLRRGEIAGLKTGNEWRVWRSAVTEYLRNQERKNKPAE